MGIAGGKIRKYLYGDSDNVCVFLFGFDASRGGKQGHRQQLPL